VVCPFRAGARFDASTLITAVAPRRTGLQSLRFTGYFGWEGATVRTSLLIAWGLALSLTGCSGDDTPPLGTVKGVVKLDGAPLADATVTFVPQTGRASAGVTKSDGSYELEYLAGKKGAITGTHTVRISTYRGGDPDAKVPETPEKVPRKYNAQSKVTKDVAAGPNEINFDLDSKEEKAAPAKG